MSRTLDIIDGYHTNNGQLPDILKPTVPELGKLFNL
jgi:hypothetical protein